VSILLSSPSKMKFASLTTMLVRTTTSLVVAPAIFSNKESSVLGLSRQQQTPVASEDCSDDAATTKLASGGLRFRMCWRKNWTAESWRSLLVYSLGLGKRGLIRFQSMSLTFSPEAGVQLVKVMVIVQVPVGRDLVHGWSKLLPGACFYSSVCQHSERG
jgi:hypothetical protein